MHRYQRIPIYGSEFTLGMIRHRLSEANMLHKTDLVAVADGETISIGDFLVSSCQ